MWWWQGGDDEFIHVTMKSKSCLCVHAKSLQSCPALWGPMDYSLPGSSVGFSRQEFWSGLPCPSSWDLPDPGIEPVTHVSCIGRQILYHSLHLGSPEADYFELTECLWDNLFFFSRLLCKIRITFIMFPLSSKGFSISNQLQFWTNNCFCVLLLIKVTGNYHSF